jgi:hypothetical protein
VRQMVHSPAKLRTARAEMNPSYRYSSDTIDIAKLR